MRTLLRSCLCFLGFAAGASAQTPDLSGLDRDTRMSIELACTGEKIEGPAPYRRCIERQLGSIEGIGAMPDLSGFDRDTRMSIELACTGDKISGPVPYRKCLERQLQSIDGLGDLPDISVFDRDTRMSIEFACTEDKIEGPAAYHRCLEKQINSIDGPANAIEVAAARPESSRSQAATAARSVWHFHTEGAGTPFEKRWAVSEPVSGASSPGSMLGYAGIHEDRGDLRLYVVNPYPVGDAFLSALAGEKLECEFDNWRLGVDQEEFLVADTSSSTDNSATFIQAQDPTAFWQAFVDGSVLAVEVQRTCEDDMMVATLVYSLTGSRAAVEYVLK